MVLQALTQYYEILAEDPKSEISPFGYSVANVSFALNLSKQGKLLDIFPLFDQVQRGKKTIEVPRRMQVPEQIKRNHVRSHFLCDNGAYVLGISDKDQKYSEERHEAFRTFHLEILEPSRCAEAIAIVSYLEGYEPKAGKDLEPIARNLDSILAGGNFVFMLDGKYIHEASEMQKIWEHYQAQLSSEDQGQCLVTGEIAPIARLHPNLKGVAGAQPSGSSLVSFDKDAFKSYGKERGMNSPVSEKVAFSYTTVLNYLLSRGNPNRKFTIGDTAIVYWAENTSKVYASVVEGLFSPETFEGEVEKEERPIQDASAELFMREITKKMQAGQPLDIAYLLTKLDTQTQFHVLGLAPNAGRLSIRFYLQDPFEKIVERIASHYEDMSISPMPVRQIVPMSPYRIERETVSRKATDKSAPPLLGGAIMRAMLTNGPYPFALFSAIINRIRADMDDTSKRIEKINSARAAIIKAYLLRKYRHQPGHPIQEVLSMALNEESTNQAYLLGRLFSMLESLQRSAAKPAKLNATIKDRYFTSACASPATVFPVLLRLSQHHISKAGWGDKQIGNIMKLLEVDNRPFPSRLSLDQQGIFVLGYYHQRVASFAHFDAENVADEEDPENN